VILNMSCDLRDILHGPVTIL